MGRCSRAQATYLRSVFRSTLTFIYALSHFFSPLTPPPPSALVLMASVLRVALRNQVSSAARDYGVTGNTDYEFIQTRAAFPRASVRNFASARPQTLKERLGELIPKEIENVGNAQSLYA